MNIRTTLIGLVGIAATIPALANAACADTFPNGQCLFGEPAVHAAPAQTVDLAKTRSVHVPYGKTVKFVNGDQSFTWTFNGADERGVALAKIAPDGIDTRMAAVYVGQNPLLAE
jgi:hypothetical protein